LQRQTQIFRSKSFVVVGYSKNKKREKCDDKDPKFYLYPKVLLAENCLFRREMDEEYEIYLLSSSIQLLVGGILSFEDLP
jgi:hypothetical protein